MARKEINLITLSFEEHAQLVLEFFIRNKDFFENYENTTPTLDYVKNTFTSCPEGVPVENKVLVGCLSEGSMVGFSELIRDRHRAGEWLLGLLITEEKYRKTLFGGRIVLKMLEFIKASGASTVVGGVVEDNSIAKNFWDSIGATATDIIYEQELNGKKVPTRVVYKEL